MCLKELKLLQRNHLLLFKMTKRSSMMLQTIEAMPKILFFKSKRPWALPLAEDPELKKKKIQN